MLPVRAAQAKHTGFAVDWDASFGVKRMKLHPLLLALVAVSASAEQHTYLIGLSDPPLVEHARAAAQAMPSPPSKAAMRRAMQSADSMDYARKLTARRQAVLAAAAQDIGHPIVPRHAFQTASNGFAAVLDDNEAARIATLPGVVAVRRSRVEHVLTDAGPQWIGASDVWNGSVPGVAATKGEGVVIGIIDTGINPTHPSFAAAGGDGFTNVNPRGHYYGLCATGQAKCTPKLIGIYDMTDEGSNGVDTVGHGSHVAGIAAGNTMSDALRGMTTSLTRNVSGVAPHANIIMYKACTLKDGSGTCDESDLVAAIDQAVSDGVDVINYSIGGDAQDPYTLLSEPQSDVYAFFQARSAGVVVAVAAGNEGPGPGSISEPANAPWVIAAANATHNRVFVNALTDFAGGSGSLPGTTSGQGFTANYGPATIVYAGDYGNALCGAGDTEGVAPTGRSNPFAAGTFHGEIVVCDRGIYARVEKGYNVKAAGAGGYVLANAESDGESVISDDHFLPAVHIGYIEGVQLKLWLGTPGTHSGRITGVSVSLADENGDILESDSSRGPFGFRGGLLKPDITAPGSNILSSDGFSAGLALLSGTSMAAPHVAGAAALLIAAHPDWDPSRVESALLGTALPSVRLAGSDAPATPLDQGDGRVQVAVAARAGLYLGVSAADYRASITDPTKLNRIGVESESCSHHCTFTRTVTDMSGGGTWQSSAAVAGTHGAVTVTPSQFTLSSGTSQIITIDVDTSDPALVGSWLHGRILLHKSSGPAASDTALPLSVFVSSGATPAFIDITAHAPGGSQIVQLSGLTALPQASFDATTLFPATDNYFTLATDPTPNDIYSKLPGTGKSFVMVPIDTYVGVDTGRSAVAFTVEIADNDAPKVNLFGGIDYNGDGVPSAAEQTCKATTSGGTARCTVDLRGAPATSVWFLVEIPQGGGANYSVHTTSAELSTSYTVGVDLTSFQTFFAAGPGHTADGVSFPLRLYWTEPTDGGLALTPGRYYGAVQIGVSSSGGSAGLLPVGLTRVAGNDDALEAFIPGKTRSRVIEGGETLGHQFIDVSGAGTLTVQTTNDSGSGSVAWYAVRTDFPASSSAAAVDAAPAADASSVKWTTDSSSPNVSKAIPVTPGRWYIVAAANGDRAQVSVQTTLTLNSNGAPTQSGSYYNPHRSGHGIFISQAAGQQVLYWYTYLEDGTAVWYFAQAAAPTADSAAWTAQLRRVTWDGAAPDGHPVVGDATVTPVDADTLVFSWHLFGVGGSERFTVLSRNACVPVGGQSVGLSGQWYAPAQSGYGMDVVADPQTQFDAFYLYDALGQPRWLVGSGSPFASSMSIAMNQVSGFCPTCTYVPTTMQPVGTLAVSYANASNGTFSTNVTLAPPLSGTFNISQPTLRLTGSTSCEQ
jgi:subtilisin family serine protease